MVGNKQKILKSANATHVDALIALQPKTPCYIYNKARSILQTVYMILTKELTPSQKPTSSQVGCCIVCNFVLSFTFIYLVILFSHVQRDNNEAVR